VIVVLLKFESIHDQTGEEIGVPGVGDLHLSQHASDDDFNVLVVDFHPLRAVDLLDFMEQVLLNSLFTADTQDVVRDQWAFYESLSSLDDIGGVHQEAFSWRYQMLDFFSAFASNDDRAFSALAILGDLHGTVEFCNDCRILWLSSFEVFRDARKTPGDVLTPGCFARHFSQFGTCVDFLAFLDVDNGLVRQIVNVDSFAVCVFDDDLRMVFAA